MADVVVKRWWVLPVAQVVVRSELSFVDMHSRLESLFDTDDRVIAEHAPSEPPRRPFQGYARMGEVALMEWRQDRRGRQHILLVGRGRVSETARGCDLVLRFRPPIDSLLVVPFLMLGVWYLVHLARLAAHPIGPVLLFAIPYLIVLATFWSRFARSERVLRQAFNG